MVSAWCHLHLSFFIYWSLSSSSVHGKWMTIFIYWRAGLVQWAVSLGHRILGSNFEAASRPLLHLWGDGLAWFIPFSDPTHVGSSGSGSDLFICFFYMYHKTCISRLSCSCYWSYGHTCIIQYRLFIWNSWMSWGWCMKVYLTFWSRWQVFQTQIELETSSL